MLVALPAARSLEPLSNVSQCTLQLLAHYSAKPEVIGFELPK
jgi:hypothetical protein